MATHALQRAHARGRSRASEGVRPLLAVWLAWLAVMTSANLATPLYAVYAQRFGFSSLVLTAVFAAYAIVLIPGLLLFGRLSDRFGRRPILFAGLAMAGLGLALFAAAQRTAWLFAARIVQGLAVALISGPATAALVEFDPRRDEQRPALLAGLAQAGGCAFGVALTGVLAEWGPARLQLPFAVVLAAIVAAGLFALTLPEPAGARGGDWKIQWPRVPRERRGDFARVSLTAATAWGTVALYLSIVPSYAGDLLRTKNLALLGALTALAFVASCGAQAVSQRLHLPLRAAQAGGLALLAAGLAALVVASPLHSLGLLLAAAIAAGAGHGFSFLSAQDELNALAPEERRGEVTAAFIACIYLVVSVSVIATGMLDVWLTLPFAVGAVAVALAAAAATTAAWQLGALAR